MPDEPTRIESYEVHSEARGPHWIAWVTRGISPKPDRSVVVVARTQDEAEAHARQWFDSYLAGRN